MLQSKGKQHLNNENDFMVAYCVSDKGKMPQELLSSLMSINRYIKRDNIIVFYTPPRSEKNYNSFSKYANVKKVNNLTTPFKYMAGRAPSRYGEILGHMGGISSSNVFILDCDTIINKDIKELLNDDFDVAFRVAKSWKNIDKLRWQNLFHDRGKKPIPVPNKGFMIFKDDIHKKITKEIRKYMNTDIPHVSPYNYQKDQYAIALAISGYKVKLWDKYVHAYEWCNESNIDSYVLHGRKFNCFVKTLLKMQYKMRKIRHKVLV